MFKIEFNYFHPLTTSEAHFVRKPWLWV